MGVMKVDELKEHLKETLIPQIKDLVSTSVQEAIKEHAEKGTKQPELPEKAFGGVAKVAEQVLHQEFPDAPRLDPNREKGTAFASYIRHLVNGRKATLRRPWITPRSWG